MNVIKTTQTFNAWLESFKDIAISRRIKERIARLEYNHFGDYKALGEGLYELRLDFAAGYRIYYIRKGNVIYLLLNGGDKGTQSRDIEKARKIAAQFSDET